MKEPALEPGLSGLVPRVAAGSQGDAGPEQGNVVPNSAFSGPPLTVNGTSFPLISFPALSSWIQATFCAVLASESSGSVLLESTRLTENQTATQNDSINLLQSTSGCSAPQKPKPRSAGRPRHSVTSGPGASWVLSGSSAHSSLWLRSAWGCRSWFSGLRAAYGTGPHAWA